MRHDMLIYISTNLECDEESAWDFVETLEWFGHTLTAVLRERLYRDRSIKDSLTGFFPGGTSWKDSKKKRTNQPGTECLFL